MARWILVAGSLLGGLIAVGAVAVGIGGAVWQRQTERAVARLQEGRGAGVVDLAVLSPEMWDSLPAPVARYFERVLPRDQPPASALRIRWAGEFQTQPDGGWVPFTAEQHFTVRPLGFVWDAEIQMLPLVPVRVRDGYRAGAGTMLGRIGGVLRVVDEGGTPEMAQSALARWLGEAVWFPTALLPGAAGGGVRWEAIDENTARATITDEEVSAAAEFRFAPTGEIIAMKALRYRDVDGTPVLTPFEGHYGEYARISGVLVPQRAEVAWLLPDGRFPYWRGRPEAIEYEPAR